MAKVIKKENQECNFDLKST